MTHRSWKLSTLLLYQLLAGGLAGQLRLSRQPHSIDPPHLAQAWVADASSVENSHRRAPIAEPNSTSESPFAPHAPWVPRTTTAPLAQDLQPRIDSARPAMSKNATNILVDESPGEIAEILFKVWYFMLWEAACVVILVASASIARTFTKENVSEIDLAQNQLQLLMVALMVSPFLRPYVAVRNWPIVGVFFIRCIFESEIIMVVANRLPSTAFSLTRRSAEKMLADGMQKGKYGKQGEALSEAIVQDATLLEQKVDSGKWWVMMCMGCRAMITFARLLLDVLAEDAIEDKTSRVAYHTANLALLGLALAVVFRRLMPSVEEGASGKFKTWIHLMDSSWEEHLSFMHVRWVAASLLIVMQLQDIILIAYFGSENVAQMYAACLQIHEIALAQAWIFVVVLRNHCEKRIAGAQPPLRWSSRVRLIFRAPILRPSFADSPVQLLFELGKKEMTPCWQTPSNLAEYEVRSTWRGVLFDIVTTRVRSRCLPALMLTCAVLHAYDALPASVDFVQGLAAKSDRAAVQAAYSFAMQMATLVNAILLWLLMGLSLIGNNIFVRRRWLCIAICVFLCDAVFWLHRFSSPNTEKEDGTMSRLGHLWMYAACLLMAIVGAILAFALMLDGEVESHYYKSERNALRYCAAVLEGQKEEVPGLQEPPRMPSRTDGSSSWSLHSLSRTGTALVEAIKSRGVKVQRPSCDFPPMLMAGVMATLPLVLALTLFVVYAVKVAMYYARIAKLFAMAVSYTAEQDDFFTALDVNLDRQLSPREVGLTTSLQLIGMPELTGAVAALWMRVDTNLDGRLNVVEARKFLNHLVGAKAALMAWMVGDVDAASEGLVQALDDNPKDMALSAAELPRQDVELLLQHSAPDLAGALAGEIDTAWEDSDLDSTGTLRADELAVFFRMLKARVGELKTATSQVTRQILQGAFNAAQGNWTQIEQFEIAGQSFKDVVSKSWARDALQRFKKQQLKLKGGLQDAQDSTKHMVDGIRHILEQIPQAAHNTSAATRAVVVAALKYTGGPDASYKAVAMFEASDATGEANTTGLLERSTQHWLGFMEAGFDPQFEEALPNVLRETLPLVQDALSRGLLMLSLLRAEPNDAASTMIEAFDEAPADGRVDIQETGLLPVLTQVSPAVADRFTEFLRSLGLQESSLDKRDLSRLISATKTMLKQLGGDLDEDGKVTEKDLALFLQGQIHNLLRGNSLKSEVIADEDNTTALMERVTTVRRLAERQTFLQEGVGVNAASQTLLSDGGEHAYRHLQFAAQMGMGYEENIFSEGLNILSDSQQTSELWHRILHWATGILADLNLDRVEWCLYTSEIVSMGIAIYTLVKQFTAYVETFEKCQVGDYSFKGGTAFKELSKRPDFSTFYPGMIMSTVIFSQLFLSVVLFVVLVVATSTSVWLFVWDRFRFSIFWLGMALFIQLVVLRVFFLDWYCMKKGEVIRPRLFSGLLTVLTIMNFALGVLATITRLVCMLPFLFSVFLRLDKSMLDEEEVQWDFGIVTFLSTVGVCYKETNPIKQGFISQLMPNASTLYGPVRSKEASPDDRALCEYGGRQYSKKLRNKWWLLATMSNNPSIAELRCRPPALGETLP